MMYVKIDKATGAKIAGPQRIDGEPANPSHKPHAWVPLVKLDDPTYNPETEKLVPFEGADEAKTEYRVGRVKATMSDAEVKDHNRLKLEQSDADYTRVIDDVVDLLIARDIFAETDLPDVVQAKRAERKMRRGKA